MDLTVPEVTRTIIKWKKPRRDPVQGIVYHAMGEYIVIGDGVLSAASFLQESPEICGEAYSAHCLSKPSGSLEIMASDDWRTWHAGVSELGGIRHLNNTFLGIEFLVPGDWVYDPDFIRQMKTGTVKFTEEQYVAGAWWIATKMLQYQFGRPAVVFHSQVAGDDVRGEGRGKLDPGVGFNHGKLTSLIYKWRDQLDLRPQVSDV